MTLTIETGRRQKVAAAAYRALWRELADQLWPDE